MPPTLPGPGMFPATAAACAAAAACAVAACCCICLWHCRRSNTWQHTAFSGSHLSHDPPAAGGRCEPRGSHLDVGARVDLVHGVARRSARLPVQVIALHEHGVVAHAAHPHVALAAALQLHAFTDGVTPVAVRSPPHGAGEPGLSEAEAVASRRVHVAVHGYDRAAGGHLEHLAHLDVHFKVGDGAPELGSCNENRAGVTGHR
ncbi:hypothetical protein EYF80_052999 [Liparis tanakae]|uniref:Uncharacterized protein n=1 Tax=Liparis tanakae TaxID=230148 RepID=A0A4Z2F7J9_9TELE|nr:hypothetical protein EYF80_052999 [Liparis tanakae]